MVGETGASGCLWMNAKCSDVFVRGGVFTCACLVVEAGWLVMLGTLS